MTAVTFALPAESSEFLKLLEHRTTRSDVVAGKIGPEDVRVFHTGVGSKVARERSHAFLSSERPAFVISSGFAGAVAPQLGVGDVVIAENFSAPAFVTPAAAALADLNVHVGKLATASSIVDSSTDRAALARENGAIAVDMETEMIAAACAAQGVPMLSLRAISDSAAAPLPAPPGVLFDVDQQRTDYGALLLHIVRHPSAIGRLARFATQIAVARRSLTRALELAIRAGVGAA